MSKQYLSFSAEINQHTAEQLIAAVTNLCSNGATEIHLMMSTPGGIVNNGITIYHTLRALPCKIITYNMGSVDSIGIVIFLAGDKRYACPSSTFTFHGVSQLLPAGQEKVLDARSIQEVWNSIGTDNQRIALIYGQHMNLGPEAIGQLFVEANTKDAGWAKGPPSYTPLANLKFPSAPL